MSKSLRTDGWPELLDPPSEVQVTVFGPRAEPSVRKRAPDGLARVLTRLWTVALALVAVAIAALMVVAAVGIGSRASRADDAGVRAPGRAGVASAYGYPPSCMRVTISAVDPTFARADFDRAGSCGFSTDYPTALFHRFYGEWHPMLYAVSYPCPLPSVPPPVRRELSVCP